MVALVAENPDETSVPSPICCVITTGDAKWVAPTHAGSCNDANARFSVGHRPWRGDEEPLQRSYYTRGRQIDRQINERWNELTSSEWGEDVGPER